MCGLFLILVLGVLLAAMVWAWQLILGLFGMAVGTAGVGLAKLGEKKENPNPPA